MVLDPFCGCGTTVAAAQALHRSWIGIDITFLAIDLIDALSAGKEISSVRGESVRPVKEISRETALAGAELPAALAPSLGKRDAQAYQRAKQRHAGGNQQPVIARG